MAPFLEQHFDLSKKIEKEEIERQDFYKQKEFQEQERERMKREMKSYQKEKSEKEKRFLIGTTPENIVVDDDEFPPLVGTPSSSENDPVSSSSDSEHEVIFQPGGARAQLPARPQLPEPPGIVTRGVMRILGLKPGSTALPDRPPEYKKYTKRREN